MACASDSYVAPSTVCQGSINVSVESGPTPKFHWTPACGLHRISVIAPPSNGPVSPTMWDLRADARFLGPGLRYGDKPEGTVTLANASPVTHGTTYAVLFVAESGQPPIASLSWSP